MENFSEKTSVMRGVRYSETDDKLICAAARVQRLRYSEFIRRTVLERARRIIRQQRLSEMVVND